MAKPLNKKKDGKVYTRPAEIEACIDEALSQDEETLLRRARIKDRSNAEYMLSECLLHLIREAQLARDDKRVNRLLPVLLQRCESILKATVRDGGLPDASGLRDEILGSFSEMLAKAGTDRDNHVLDYFEVRFNHALSCLKNSRLKREGRRREIFEDIPRLKDEDEDDIDTENVLARMSEAARTPATQESFAQMGQMLRAIEKELAPPDRQALVLVCMQGHKIESEDPNEVTAATLCNVSGRAIRKRLRKAAEALKQFKREQ